MTNTIWKPIEQAPPDTGPLLLREGSGSLYLAFVGAQADNGRWYVGRLEVHPAYFCTIPAFDLDDGTAPHERASPLHSQPLPAARMIGATIKRFLHCSSILGLLALAQPTTPAHAQRVCPDPFNSAPCTPITASAWGFQL